MLSRDPDTYYFIIPYLCSGLIGLEGRVFANGPGDRG